MTTISGPKIQVPSAITPVVTQEGTPSIDYMNFYHAVADTLFAETRNGPTSSRPASSMPGRFIGMPFFDLTLGKPVFLKVASSSVWVDAAGNVV